MRFLFYTPDRISNFLPKTDFGWFDKSIMKTIYFGHSREFDYQNELYIPIRESKLNKEYNIIFPHEYSQELYDTKGLFKSAKCDLFATEVSYPSTGLGIEMAWAGLYNIPIICFYKKDAKISGSLQAVTDKFIEYKDKTDLINKLREELCKRDTK
jgi:hypothetical protein